MNKTSCNNYCNQVLKKEYEWLKEVDKFALTNTIYNMDSAYQKFFKEHTGFPKFKSKRDNKKSYSTNFTNNNIEVSFGDSRIKLPKLKWTKVKIHRELQEKSSNDIQDMLMLKKGINWNDFPTYQKRGSCCIRNKIVVESNGIMETTQLRDASKSENEWIVDKNIPIFKGDGREYIEKLVYVGEES